MDIDEETVVETEETEKTGICKEVAEKEFSRFCRRFDIFSDIEEMEDVEKSAFLSQKRKIVREIVAGNLTVDEEGNLVYRLKCPLSKLESMTFKRPKGSVYTRTDIHEDGEWNAKVIEAVSCMTRVHTKTIISFDSIDTKFCLAVGTLFLAQ